MREIKFRGKPYFSRTWVYGSLLIWPDKDCYIVYRKDGDLSFEMTKMQVVPSTIGQYTGLKDKNDKEIYEGDIVSVSYGHPGLDSSGVIEHRCGGFILRYRDHGYLNPVDFSDCDIRILGNIHDNPELLKGSEDDA